MNKILLKSIKSGLTTGIILIFFEMINLTSTLAISIEKIISGNSKVKVATPDYMILVIGIVVLLAAASFTSKNNNFGAKPTLAKKLLAGVVIDLVSGGMLSILNGILSYFVENGTDIRTYIEPLSPDVIRNFLFQTDIQTAVMIYFITTLSGAILGTLISYLFQTTGQPALRAAPTSLSESPTIKPWLMETPSRSAHSSRASGAGLGWAAHSPPTTAVKNSLMPNRSNRGRANSADLLVTQAMGRPAVRSSFKPWRAPG